MTTEQIISLVGAGFTKNDILTLASQNMQTSTQPSVPTPAPTPTPTPAPTPAPVTVPVTAPVTAPVTSPVTSQYAGQALNNTPDTFVQGVQAMNGRLDTIAGLLQRNNILNSQMPPQPTTDDMLAAIINPPVVGGEK